MPPLVAWLSMRWKNRTRIHSDFQGGASKNEASGKSNRHQITINSIQILMLWEVMGGNTIIHPTTLQSFCHHVAVNYLIQMASKGHIKHTLWKQGQWSATDNRPRPSCVHQHGVCKQAHRASASPRDIKKNDKHQAIVQASQALDRAEAVLIHRWCSNQRAARWLSGDGYESLPTISKMVQHGCLSCLGCSHGHQGFDPHINNNNIKTITTIATSKN